MFSKSAQYYDEIYASIDKDYPAEVKKAHKIIQQHKQTKGKLLLDVACGTGAHAGLLSKYYQVEGLDLDPEMLSVARKKHPKIRFHQGDMTDFSLDHPFDVVVCLFSSIGYVRTKARLQKAVKTMTRHLLPGGVLLIEPWFTPKQWHSGRVSATEVSKPNLRIIRMSWSGQRGKLSLIEFQYLIGTSKGIEHHTETHELGLFAHKEYMDAFRGAGLKVTHDPTGLDGRGLYIGIKPNQL
ncbi:MAG TPA: class I SAM-dependent methyltransferase [Anaerolineales bacterium]|nr:class I SAM-dependent methyltransferase [Anaerolineales bacterium]